MAVKFFKKLSPKNPVILADNSPILFTTLDSITGYYATDIEPVQEFFLRCMREQRYGLSEISAQEFDEQYLQKKTSMTDSPKRWREEMSSGSMRASGFDPVSALGSASVAAAISVSASDVRKEVPVRLEPAPQLHDPPHLVGQEEIAAAKPEQPKFKATVGRRVVKKAAAA